MATPVRKSHLKVATLSGRSVTLQVQKGDTALQVAEKAAMELQLPKKDPSSMHAADVMGCIIDQLEGKEASPNWPTVAKLLDASGTAIPEAETDLTELGTATVLVQPGMHLDRFLVEAHADYQRSKDEVMARMGLWDRLSIFP